MSHYSEENIKLLKIAPYYSVGTALVIFIIKFYSWALTDSVSIFASLMDSLLDISASAINLVALRLAITPPDHNHRFGHNKIEDLAVFGQSIFFFFSGIFAFYSAGQHMIHPVEIDHVDIGIYCMIACIVLTLFLLIYQSYVIKKTGSTLMKADKLHYTADLMTNGIVMISLYFSNQFHMLDAILGTAIACYIIYSSYGLFVRSIKNLVDEEFNDDERSKILGIIGEHKEVLGVHEFKTRYAGNKPFIQCHIEMDGDRTLTSVHEISDRIMEEILKVFPGAEIIIHQDPAGVEHDVPYREKL